jgi:putative sterol carrier protein
MAEFLSPEWVDELDAAARASESLAARTRDLTFTVQQIVQDTPRGDVHYYLTADDNSVRVRTGSVDSPDLTLIADYGVARAISAGTGNAQEALAAGRLKIEGGLALLLGNEGVFAALEDVFASVRGQTTYKDGPTMPA